MYQNIRKFCSQNAENKHNGIIKSIPMLTFSYFALISAIVSQSLPETKDTPHQHYGTDISVWFLTKILILSDKILIFAKMFFVIDIFRYLQTLTQIATERNSTIVFPIPIEMMKGMGGKGSSM